MIELRNLCLGCMRDIGRDTVCANCGWHRGEIQGSPFLSQGVDVGGRYIVGRKISSGGDGTTYIAWDLDMQKSVYLREFLPDAIASRETGETALQVLSGCEKVFADCKNSFYSLWDKIIKLNGLSALIHAKQILRDYGTLYVVLENSGFIPLDEYLNALPGRRMSWEALCPVLMPVLSTLATLHAAGIVHGGISPYSVMVAPDGRFYIGGFSIIQARCSVGDLNSELYAGYSAAEQYGARQKIGPWSDVYALACVMYRCLVGQDPVPASQRLVRDELMIPGDVARALPPHVLNAMIDALQTKPENRTVEVEQLRCGLTGQPFQKKTYPLSFYNYDDVSYVNQDKKPYVAQTEYFTQGNGIPKPSERGGANVSRTYQPPVDKMPQSEKKTPSSPEPEKSGKSRGLAVFLIVLLLLAAAAAVYFGFFSDFASSPEKNQTTVSQTQSTYQVPNFVGRTDVSMKSDATIREQFKLVYQQEYSIEAEKGVVFRQSVEAGTVVPAGSEIVIYVSLGPKDIVVPDVVGIDAQQAKAQLEEMGFVVQITEKANDGTAQQGFVGSVAPDVGTQMKQGQTVYLHVWGAPPTTATQPIFDFGNNSDSGNDSGFGFFDWF